MNDNGNSKKFKIFTIVNWELLRKIIYKVSPVKIKV